MVQGKRNRKVVSAPAGIELRQCTCCGRKLPPTEFYANGTKYIRHQCKDCTKERVKQQKKAASVGCKHCALCGQLLPLEMFYKTAKNYSYYCMSCSRKEQSRIFQERMADPEKKKQILATRARYRERHREELREAEKMRRRKEGAAPAKRVNREKVCEMYKAGLPVPMIAEECKCSEITVRAIAYQEGVHRKKGKRAKLCANCWLYPCFSGIESMSSNLAETCKSYHLRGKS